MHGRASNPFAGMKKPKAAAAATNKVAFQPAKAFSFAPCAKLVTSPGSIPS
jgi:hypothetical protein